MASRFGRNQLEWVQRNRTRRSRTKQAGEEISRFADDVQRREVEPAMSAAAAVAPIVDEEFRRHCRVGGTAGGVVTIYVVPAQMISVMQRKWYEPLRGAMAARGGPWRGATIRFASGQDGVAVPEV